MQQILLDTLSRDHPRSSPLVLNRNKADFFDQGPHRLHLNHFETADQEQPTRLCAAERLTLSPHTNDFKTSHEKCKKTSRWNCLFIQACRAAHVNCMKQETVASFLKRDPYSPLRHPAGPGLIRRALQSPFASSQRAKLCLQVYEDCAAQLK